MGLGKWVARSVLPVMQLMTRGMLLLPEHQELVRQLCFVVSLHLPEYAVTMALELLPVDGLNWEAPMTGVAAILSMLTEVPNRAAGCVPSLSLAATTGGLERGLQSQMWQPHPTDIEQLLALVKQGGICVRACVWWGGVGGRGEEGGPRGVGGVVGGVTLLNGKTRHLHGRCGVGSDRWTGHWAVTNCIGNSAAHSSQKSRDALHAQVSTRLMRMAWATCCRPSAVRSAGCSCIATPFTAPAS